MGKRFIELTCILENSHLKDIGVKEENCLAESRLVIDVNTVESVRQSFDEQGNVEKENCYIRTTSGGEHCVNVDFDTMVGYMNNV